MKLENDACCRQIVFQIRKQKYAEALHDKDHSKALHILVHELKVFLDPASYQILYIEVTTNFSPSRDAKFERPTLSISLKKLAKENPIISDKLHFPALPHSRLEELYNRSFKHSSSPSSNPPLHRDDEIQVQDTQTDENDMIIQIDHVTQCRSIRLPDFVTVSGNKISRPIYTNSGDSLLVLCSNGTRKMWMWEVYDMNPTGLATATVGPQIQSALKINTDMDANYQGLVPSVALTNDDIYLVSTSAGDVSVSNLERARERMVFSTSSPATVLTVRPQDSYTIAVGLEDGTITIYDLRVCTTVTQLHGHANRITAISFSRCFEFMVSLGGDAQLCIWETNLWTLKNSLRFTDVNQGTQISMGGTNIECHINELNLLILRDAELAVYNAKSLGRTAQWAPRESFSGSISDATYSCDGFWVYAGFADGSICVFEGDTLRPRCRISPSVHIRTGISGDTIANPILIAAHPEHPNQLALALRDGGVQVVEPLISEGQWGVSQIHDPLCGSSDDTYFNH